MSATHHDTPNDAAFHVRALNPEDVNAFKALRLSALREYPQYFLDNVTQAAQKSEAEWTAYLVGDHKKVFGLFNHDTLIGIASIYTPNPDDAPEIANLAMGFIQPEFRGLGLSTLLYDARLDWAKNNAAIKTLKISHRKGNLISAKAVNKNGFQYIGENPETYGDGTTEISLKYEMVLTQD